MYNLPKLTPLQKDIKSKQTDFQRRNCESCNKVLQNARHDSFIEFSQTFIIIIFLYYVNCSKEYKKGTFYIFLM